MQAKTKELKNALNNDFRLIHELCVFVLCNSRKPDLVRATLDTLAVYLTWVRIWGCMGVCLAVQCLTRQCACVLNAASLVAQARAALALCCETRMRERINLYCVLPCAGASGLHL